ERDRNAAFGAASQEPAVGIELAPRLVQAGRRDLDADARRLDRGSGLEMEVVRLLVACPHTGDLDEIRVREDVEETRPGGVAEPDEIAAPGLASRKLVRERRGLVDREAVDEVHRAEQVVPRVRLEQLPDPDLGPREVVDLEPELDRQTAALRLLDRGDVVVEVIGTALEHPRDLPEALALAEVVDMVAEPDLVDPRPASRLRALLGELRRVR